LTLAEEVFTKHVRIQTARDAATHGDTNIQRIAEFYSFHTGHNTLTYSLVLSSHTLLSAIITRALEG